VLKRQKVLLALLLAADRPVSRVEFVKAAFLLKQETVLSQEHTFYDFVPYRFGPFSFSLYRELCSLQRDGYVTANEHSVQIDDRNHIEARMRSRELDELCNPKRDTCFFVGTILAHPKNWVVIGVYWPQRIVKTAKAFEQPSLFANEP